MLTSKQKTVICFVEPFAFGTLHQLRGAKGSTKRMTVFVLMLQIFAPATAT